MSLAHARALSFAYEEGRPALAGVDLTLRAGEVTLIEGSSGGGKTTLLRAFAGLVPHFHGGVFAGRVVVDGLDTLTSPPAAVARRAALLFQDPETQAVMGAVARDVAFGAQSAGVPARELAGVVRRSLAELGAEHLLARRIDELSGGERQRVALAGLLASEPRIVLLDEPTSQLDDEGAALLAGVVRRLARQRDVAVVIAEHRLERVAAVSDRRLGLARGRLGPPNATPVAASRRHVVAGAARAELQGVVAGFGSRSVLRGTELTLHAGTVTVLTGANGSGKTTLLRALAGLHPLEAGAIRVDGRDVTGVPAERRFPCVALVGQDGARHLLAERVDAELAMAPRALGLRGRERRTRVARTLAELGLGHLAQRHPRELSAGQRQRVALGAILSADPCVIALDEPTRGVDPEHKQGLARLLRARAAAGAAVLVATHDRAFAAAVADHVVALRAGRIDAETRVRAA